MSKKETAKHESMRRYIGAALICFIVVLGVYCWRFWGLPLGGATEFGAFGDFVGGVVNPLLGFVTIWLLVGSLKIQTKEMSYSRDELELTRNEMERGNHIYESQMLLQSRQNLREQLQSEFDRQHRKLETTFDGNLRCGTTGQAIGIKRFLEAAIKVTNERGDQQDIKRYEVLSDWDDPNRSWAAKEIRVRFVDFIVLTENLIEFTDSSVLTDSLLMSVKPVIANMELLKLYDNVTIVGFKRRLIEAVEKREAKEFPVFVRGSNKLHVEHL